ncbi:leucine--tRNA ligase [Aminobacter sp. UC22_36]|uniref:leucine--tRNA ligase n=1 Tax=Aminobacter sp. UC22_36 TaxID=3374549 RepID=UPI003758439B
MAYDPKRIEPQWQRYWQKNATFRTDDDRSRPKFYVLDMFPYPSGEGLHVGHPEGYTATDIISRYKRMRGFNVLHPMGWDAYGLPAERYAVRTGVHPAITTRNNIGNFKSQVQRLGFSYDWSREFSTTDPDFVRWTQWIFLKLYERGLAYQAEVPVNWCPAQGTVLANEEVKDGKYVETGEPVERRLMRQWMLKITDYADRLLEDLDDLDWPEGIKTMQRNWIGRSVGAEITFVAAGSKERLTVYTTRPETIWGATSVVLSPEHPLASVMTTPAQRDAVNAYLARTAALSDVERSQERARTGVFTGTYVVNPATGTPIPVWIADYVVMGYGTGAVMAVPAHDGRDHEFARSFGLPIVAALAVPTGFDIHDKAWEGEGRLVNSGAWSGLDAPSAKKAAIAWLAEQGIGQPRKQYRLRDWLFSRQRYWGEPFPILHRADGVIVPLSEDALPLLAPELDDYKPTMAGDPPLARAQDWMRTSDPATGLAALRETNTMPQWAGSCWYYLRFADPKNAGALIDPTAEKYWLPVDLYVGGAEHAVLHLLYARFWHKVLYDIGVVSTKEPFQKLFNQGMILAFSYRDASGKYYRPDEVSERDGQWFAGNEPVSQQIEKMSKSKFNVVNPDEVIDLYGADAMRLYEMFMGPLDVAKPWQMSGVAGVSRFLHRVWRMVADDADGLSEQVCDIAPPGDIARLMHKTIRAVGEDIETMRFNTAISKLMEMSNALLALEQRPRAVVETFVLLLAPFAPHICEEFWRMLGHEASLAYAPWPSFDAVLAEDERREYVVQINGKLRHKLFAATGLSADALVRAVKDDPRVGELLEGKQIIKEIAVPDRLVNFVVSDRLS